MVQQIEIILKPKRRGFHLVTSEIQQPDDSLAEGQGIHQQEQKQ